MLNFAKISADIAWETEVWIADNPDHMIHFNGAARDSSDWDFLVFSSIPIYEKINNNTELHREDVDLLLVGEDGKFSKPFGHPKGGSEMERGF